MRCAINPGVWIALGLVLAGRAPAADELYPIRFSRPAQVGAKYRLAAVGTLKQKTTLVRESVVLRKTTVDLGIVLEAEVENLRVDGQGHVVQKALTIQTATLLGAGKPQTLLKAGRVVIAETVDGETKFRLAEGNLSERIAKALSIVVVTKTPGADPDEIFGTRRPRRVGESWPINVQAAARSLLSQGLSADGGKIAGTVTLDGVENSSDIPCLKLTGQTRLVGLTVSKLASPGLKLSESQASARFTALYPVDRRLGKQSEEKTFTISVVADGTEGSLLGVTMHHDMTKTIKERITPAGSP